MAAFPLDDRYEIYLGAALDWVDITERVYTRDDVTITYGRADEASRPDPAELSLTLNNRDGLFSPRNPRSPYFGLLGRNTPIRVTVPGPRYLLADPSAGTPGALASDIAGTSPDVDVRFDATLTNWLTDGSTQLAGRGNYYTGSEDWLLLARDGLLHFEWSPTGSGTISADSTLPLPVPASGRLAVRATLDVDNGAGGWTVTFYTAPTMDGPWTPLGDPVTGSGATSVHAGGVMHFGTGWPALSFPASAGRIYGFQVLDGIDGPPLSTIDMATVTQDGALLLDPQGTYWTINTGSTVTDRYPRFTGEVSYWPQRWDVSGADVYTPIKAAGILRRLGQGAKPLQSTLRRRIPIGNPIAYWPMEDGENAATVVSPIPGVLPPRIVTYRLSDYKLGMKLAQDSSLVSSDALPTFDPAAETSLQMTVPTSGVSAGEWHVECVFKIDKSTRGTKSILTVYTNGDQYNQITVLVQERVGTTSPNVRVSVDDRYLDDLPLYIIDELYDYTGVWNRLQVRGVTEGFEMRVWVSIIPIGGSGVSWTNTVVSTVGRVDRVDLGWGSSDDNVPALAAGHLAVFPSYTTIYNDADTGFQGEAALDRMARLTSEELIPMEISGVPEGSEAMGPQAIDTALTLLGEAVDADGGIFGEQLDALGLTYSARRTLYNSPPTLELDYEADGEVMPPLEPVDDDQDTRNDVTVKRRDGSEARVTLDEGTLSTQAPPDGVGVYNESVTLNLAEDDQAYPIAGWRLHLGTWDEARYPTVHVALHAAPHLISQVLALRPGCVLTIANPPEWLPPDMIRLRVEGYTETISDSFQWTMDINCSPARPWTVGTVSGEGEGPADPVRADTDGCELALDALAADTVLVVHTPQAGPVSHAVWTEDAAEFPFDVHVGGELVRATGCEPRAWDSFDRTVADGWGTMTSGKVWNTTGGAASDYTVDGDTGQITLTDTATTLRFGEYLEVLGDCELLACLSVDQAAVGGDLLAGGFTRAAGSAFYWCDVAFQADGALGIEVRSGTAVVDTREATPYTYTAGDRVWLRMRTVGDRVLGRVWPDGEPEPAWQVDRTIAVDTSAAGTVGIAAASTATNTDAVVSVHDWRTVDPQQMTVTRAVNGLEKDQQAGANVVLAQPAYVAL